MKSSKWLRLAVLFVLTCALMMGLLACEGMRVQTLMWGESSEGAIGEPKTLADLVGQDKIDQVCDEEKEVLYPYACSTYREWRGTQGDTAHRGFVFHDSSGNELFTLIELGNRNLIEINSQRYQQSEEGPDVSFDEMRVMLERKYNRSFVDYKEFDPNNNMTSMRFSDEAHPGMWYYMHAQLLSTGEIVYSDSYYWDFRETDGDNAIKGLVKQLTSEALEQLGSNATVGVNINIDEPIDFDVPVDAPLSDPYFADIFCRCSISLYSASDIDSGKAYEIQHYVIDKLSEQVAFKGSCDVTAYPNYSSYEEVIAVAPKDRYAIYTQRSEF